MHMQRLLDDALVARVLRLYRAQLEDLRLYEDQLAHWQQGLVIPRQRQGMERLAAQLVRLRAESEAIVTLAQELKENTIEQILARDEVQLALDVLSGKLKRPSSG